MVGVDTNVLVRHIVQDDARQGALASELLERRCSPTAPAHITLIVLCELVWVLDSAYGYTRDQIGATLRQVLVTDSFDIEAHALAWEAWRDYVRSAADYADCLIGRLGIREGCRTTYTFDRKAAQADGFSLLDR